MEENSSIDENRIVDYRLRSVNPPKRLEQLTEKHRQLKENDQTDKNQSMIKLMKLKNAIYSYTADKQNESKGKQAKDNLAVSN